MLFDGVTSKRGTKMMADHSQKVFLASTTIAMILSTTFTALLATFAFQFAEDPSQIIFQFLASVLVVVTNAYSGWFTGISTAKKLTIPSMRNRMNHLSSFVKEFGKNDSTTNGQTTPK